MPKELPGTVADLTSIDAALAGTTDLSEMRQRLKPCYTAQADQAKRSAVAAENVGEARLALAAAERVAQVEDSHLEAINRAIAGHEGRIEAKRAQEFRDAQTRKSVEARAAATRRRQIEDGLVKLGQAI